VDSTGHVFADMKLKGELRHWWSWLWSLWVIKIRAIKTEREKPAYHTLKNQLKPNTYMKTQNW